MSGGLISRWRAKLRVVVLHEFSITQASLLLMACFFTSAVLGAVRQMLFNAEFGVSMEANAYYAAFRLPDTLFNLVAGGTLSSAMIPVLLGTVQHEGKEKAERLTSLVLTVLLVFFVILIVLLEIFAPYFVRYVLAPGFDEETTRLTVTLTRIKLVQPLLLAVGSVATAVLNSRQQFLLTAFAVLSQNIGLMAGIGATHFYPAVGIYGPTFGALGGALLNLAILSPGIISLRQRGWFTWDLSDHNLRAVIRLLIPNGLSATVNYAGAVVDTAFASLTRQLVSLPAIYNATLLANLPVTLLGYAVGLAAFPRIARQAEAGEWRAMRRQVLQVLTVTCLLAVGAIGTIYFFGRTLIHLLFERGQFDAAASDMTHAALMIYIISLPMHVGTEILSRGLIAMRDTRTPLFTNVGQLIMRTGLMWLLVGRIGLFAIPVAFVTSSSVETVVLGYILLTKLHRRIVGVPEMGADINKFWLSIKRQVWR